MGTGDEPNSGDESDSSNPVTHWLTGGKDGDEVSRRRFLVLVAVVTGAISAVAVSLQQMIGTLFTTEPSTGNESEHRPGNPVQDGAGDPPRDVLVQEYETEYRATYPDGEVIESGTDGWGILRTAIQEISESGTLFVKGRYEANSPIEINKSLDIHGEGATITVTDSTKFAFDIRGEERYETALAERTETGDYTVELERTGSMEQGDLLLIEDTGAAPVLGRGQPPGEPHSVLEVHGNTVSIEDTIVWRDGYDEGTLVYVVDPIEIRCTGFDLYGPDKNGSHVGIIARDCRNSRFEDLWLDKFGNRAIAVEGCANSRIRDCTVLQSSDIAASDGYGIQIRAGCHDVLVEGCTAKECRHPFSITPAGPREVASRSITVRDCFLSSEGSAALNCHGGSAHDIKFKGCMVHTWGDAGVRTGAQQTNVTGCEFRMDGHHAITTRNDGQEMAVTVTDTDIYGASNAIDLAAGEGYEFAPLWKLAHLDGVRAYGCRRFFHLEPGKIDRLRKLVISNCSWDTVSEVGIRIENRLDGGSITGNSFGNATNESHIQVRDQDDSRARNLQITGNRFDQTSEIEAFIRLANTQHSVVSDNTFEAESGCSIYSDDSAATGNIIKQNTLFAPEVSEALIQEDGDSVAEDNYFMHRD